MSDSDILKTIFSTTHGVGFVGTRAQVVCAVKNATREDFKVRLFRDCVEIRFNKYQTSRALLDKYHWAQ